MRLQSPPTEAAWAACCRSKAMRYSPSRRELTRRSARSSTLTGSAAALHKGAGSFKRAFEPVLKMIENADSLEQLRELMEDDTAVAKLYAAMDVSEVEELLQKVMLYADLEGRVVEDG